MPKEENQSLIGVHFDEHGNLVQNVRHTDGREETSLLDTDAFADAPADERPQPLPAPRTGALTEKLHHGLTRADHVARSVRIECVLLKAFGSPDGCRGHVVDAPGLLRQLLQAVGGEWVLTVECVR